MASACCLKGQSSNVEQLRDCWSNACTGAIRSPHIDKQRPPDTDGSQSFHAVQSRPLPFAAAAVAVIGALAAETPAAAPAPAPAPAASAAPAATLTPPPAPAAATVAATLRSSPELLGGLQHGSLAVIEVRTQCPQKSVLPAG